VDEELIPLLDGVGDVFAVGLGWGGFGGDFQSGMGEPVIEVVVEDVLAVIGQVLFGVGLAVDSLEVGERLGVNLLVAQYLYCPVKSLPAFFNLNVNRKVVVGVVVVVVNLGLDLGLAESVGDI